MLALTAKVKSAIVGVYKKSLGLLRVSEFNIRLVKDHMIGS